MGDIYVSHPLYVHSMDESNELVYSKAALFSCWPELMVYAHGLARPWSQGYWLSLVDVIEKNLMWGCNLY